VLVLPPAARAGGGPENLALVVNADSWASVTVANEYVHLRRIPPDNVIYLKRVGNPETADITAFRERILTPVLEAVTRRGLKPQIDYVVYSSDLPSSIRFGKDLEGLDLAKRKQMVGDRGSINGLTYLAAAVLAKDAKAYTSLGSNGYFRRPVLAGAGGFQERWSRAEASRLKQAKALVQRGKYAQALKIYQALAKAHADNPVIAFAASVCQAGLGTADEALASLGRAVDLGWWNVRAALAAKELRPLHGRKDFQRLVERMRAQPPKLALQPTRAFRAGYRWGADGRRRADGAGGQYLLSTMLAVTSGRGNAVSEALRTLRRSAAADGTRPEGTVYFTVNDDVRTKARKAYFAPAAEMLRDLGVAAEIVEGTLPKRKDDVAGLMIGTHAFNWASSRSTILPGAICDHFTSWGGVMTEDGQQTPLTAFLRHGAAGASGTVTEPLALAAKFPTAFLHVHYARGCSLAEAFYQSVAGPYQLLIVGDPLCRPWARVPKVAVAAIRPADPNAGAVRRAPGAPGATVSGRIEIVPEVADAPPAGVAHVELFLDGRRRDRRPPGEPFALDTAELSDGYHECRLVAVRDGPIQTQGRTIFPLTVANGPAALTVTVPDGPFAWGRHLKLAASLPGAKEIRFCHNARTVATIAGDAGEAEIDPAALGTGPVAIHPVAVLAGDAGNQPRRVAAAPIRLDVWPSPPLAPLRDVDERSLRPGPLIVLEDGRKVSLAKPDRRRWFRQAGVRDGQRFAIVGVVEAEASEVYQFQVDTPQPLTIQVGSRTLKAAGRGGWQFLPVSLAKGWHRVEIRGRAQERVWLDVRFGGPGARRITGRFRHVPVRGEKVVGGAGEGR
jgi:hypothetical protein